VTGTPFFDNDVHVTHFSIAGLIGVMHEFGQQNVQFVTSGELGDGGIWPGVLALPS
jgi:hypothetical protein